MIKIFSPNKIIYLISSKDHVKQKKGALIHDIATKDEMRIKYFEFVHNAGLNEIYFFNRNPEQLFGYFSALFTFIEAAGGLVRNGESGLKGNLPKGPSAGKAGQMEWLFIFRNGKWDLPKGKIEKGESIKDAAIREVQEECGVNELSIIRELPSTYHIYFIDKKAFLKRTYWFEMICTNAPKLSPQTEEGITEVRWITSNNLKQVYENTYESVLEVLKEIKS